MARVNIVKKIKIDGVWKLIAIPRTSKGTYDWNSLPEGLYLIEWRAGGKRRREVAGVTASQALEAQRQKKHALEGRALGLPGFEKAGETVKQGPLHIAVEKYLDETEALKKPNTLRKYKAVLERFLEYFQNAPSIDQIGGEDLTRFVIWLKKHEQLGANTIRHNAIIVAQFFKRQGRENITRQLQLPDRIDPLPREYSTADLEKFFQAAYDAEQILFGTFLLTGLREMEAVHLFWPDINLERMRISVTAKPELGFYPKRWEERAVPIPVQLIGLLKQHRPRPGSNFVFPSPAGNREYHMLDRCKAIAARAGLDPEVFDLKTFRSTFATRSLRAGFDVRTVQEWMGHKSLETTMRYLVPNSDVHDRLDQVTIPGLNSSELRKQEATKATPTRGRNRKQAKAKPPDKETVAATPRARAAN
ncbi:MAG: tyrosine-type recombinase/integrase [Bryobacterales bacterium]|nr:tyrosine-type recombinase/integrase [Bryobacterales bacterium]